MSLTASFAHTIFAETDGSAEAALAMCVVPPAGVVVSVLFPELLPPPPAPTTSGNARQQTIEIRRIESEYRPVPPYACRGRRAGSVAFVRKFGVLVLLVA